MSGFHPRDLKWIANTLLVTLKMREKLVDPEDATDRLAGTIAGLIDREHWQEEEEERGKVLGLCRPGNEDALAAAAGR